MKKHPKAAFRFGSAMAAMLVLTLLLSLTACFGTPAVDTPTEEESREVVTLPPSPSPIPQTTVYPPI